MLNQCMSTAVTSALEKIDAKGIQKAAEEINGAGAQALLDLSDSMQYKLKPAFQRQIDLGGFYSYDLDKSFPDIFREVVVERENHRASLKVNLDDWGQGGGGWDIELILSVDGEVVKTLPPRAMSKSDAYNGQLRTGPSIDDSVLLDLVQSYLIKLTFG